MDPTMAMRMNQHLILIVVIEIICLFCFSSPYSSTNSRSSRIRNGEPGFILPPVILVPGFVGSRLLGTNSAFTINNEECDANPIVEHFWFNLNKVKNVGCFQHIMSLRYDAQTNLMVHQEGVAIYPPLFGFTASVSTLGMFPPAITSYFEHLIANLESVGYKRDVNIHAAPYDFRILPMNPEFSNFVTNMKGLIEQQYNRHNNTKVFVVSHSYGGPIFRKFLDSQKQDWKDKYIKAWASVNGAFAGSVKAVHGITDGDVGYDWLQLRGRKLVSGIMSTFPAAYYLQPSENYFGPDRPYIKSAFGIYTATNISRLQNFLTNGLSEKIYSMLKDKIYNTKRPGVDFYCIISKGLPTTNILITDPRIPVKEREKYKTEGDGTLTLAELKSCHDIQKYNTNKTNTRYEELKVNHMDLLKSDTLFQTIWGYVRA